MSYCKRCDGPCEGPCFDYCTCSHCWNGWKDISFLTRLRYRIQHGWSDTAKFACCGAIAALWFTVTVALVAVYPPAAILMQALIALVMSLVLARDLWRLDD